MINSVMNYPETTLPCLLLLMAFLFKLLIDRSPTLTLFIKSLYEFPVDAAFLATSFVIAFTITSPDRFNIGLLYLLVYMGIDMLTVVFWRRSVQNFEESNYWICWSLFALNLLLALGLIIGSIQLLIGGT